ncbi:hypothetical protein L9F63_018148, partial [Diploptera punctata]
MKPVLLEESSSQELPKNVEILLSSLGNDSKIDKNDVIAVFFYVLMIETGFIPQNLDDCDLSNCDYNFNVKTLKSIYSLPKNWKIAVNHYEELFLLGNVTQYPCKLVILSMDDLIIVNLFLPNLKEQRNAYAITFQPSMYIENVSDYIPNSFKNLKELSIKFKDSLSHPAKSAILTEEKITNPSLLGLPEELKLKIFELLLPVPKDLARASMVCSNFHYLCSDQSLLIRCHTRNCEKKRSIRFLQLNSEYMPHLCMDPSLVWRS